MHAPAAARSHRPPPAGGGAAGYLAPTCWQTAAMAGARQRSRQGLGVSCSAAVHASCRAPAMPDRCPSHTHQQAQLGAVVGVLHRCAHHLHGAGAGGLPVGCRRRAGSTRLAGSSSRRSGADRWRHLIERRDAGATTQKVDAAAAPLAPAVPVRVGAQQAAVTRLPSPAQCSQQRLGRAHVKRPAPR